jgi:hypothetical protein
MFVKGMNEDQVLAGSSIGCLYFGKITVQLNVKTQVGLLELACQDQVREKFKNDRRRFAVKAPTRDILDLLPLNIIN